MEMNRERLTARPPTDQPAPGYAYFLPEEYYLLDAVSVPPNVAARITTRCVARWANRYHAYLHGSPAYDREGPLPTDRAASEAFVDEIFDWLERLPEPLYMAGFDLYQGNLVILDQRDRIPGILTLTPDQFTELQDCSEMHGLPRDLYYPAREQRTVIEPTEKFGGVVRAYQRYTPLQWVHRRSEQTARLSVPSEEERARAFAGACSQFMEALMLRMFELAEPGKHPSRDEMRTLTELHGNVGRAMLEARSRGVPQPNEPDA